MCASAHLRVHTHTHTSVSFFILCHTHTRALHRSQMEPVAAADVAGALAVTKASARLHEEKYAAFSQEYGQSGS